MKPIIILAIAAVMIAGAVGIATAEQCEFSAIAFTSTRDNPTGNPLLTAEIYLMLIHPDGRELRRLTANTDGDGFPKLSPDGKKIVFDSNRLRAADEPLNTSDLFVMNTDGTEQTFLTRGSSATWSPDSKYIAFHASASGTGLPIRPDPGAPTTDSDIFVANVDDLLQGVASPQNITNNPATVDDDPDWSPDGQRIVFTRHAVGFPTLAEIWVMKANGRDQTQLTFGEEPRAPAWSPDGTRIAYMCRRGGSDYEICVLNLADGTDTQLTSNTVLDGTPTWSPNGEQIVFAENVAGLQQLFVKNADGTGPAQQLTGDPTTDPTGTGSRNLFPAWGVARVECAQGD